MRDYPELDEHECDPPLAREAGELWFCPECARDWRSVYARDMTGAKVFIEKGLIAEDALGWQADRSRV